MGTLSATRKRTLGRGKLYFKKSGDSFYRHIGNTPSFNITTNSETLKHYDADGGIRVQDGEVPVQVDYSGAFTTDNINHENLAMLMFGAASTVAVGSGTNTTITFSDVKVGDEFIYELGKRKVSGVTITGSVLDTDFKIVDADRGLISFIVDGDFDDGDDVTVEFDNAAYSYDKTVSGSTVVEGALMLVANNPDGDDIDYILADVKLSPAGDFQIKAQEWQQLPFKLSIGIPDVGDAITANGQPYTP